MVTPEVVESAAVFMAFVHESGVLLLVAALVLRIFAGAFAKKGHRTIASMLYASALIIFLTVAAGLALLGTVLDDGWYTLAGLLCGLVAGMTVLRWYLGLRRRGPALSVPDEDGG